MSLWRSIKVRLGLEDDFEDVYDEDYYDEDDDADYTPHHVQNRAGVRAESSSVRRVTRLPDVERAREILKSLS